MSDNSGNPVLVSANEYDPDSSELSCIEANDINELDEYHSLIKMYRDYPKDLFVPELLRKYASSESDLERIRLKYFELVKYEHDDLPFAADAELKRRVYTRQGETVAVKLAQDIHSILALAEGESDLSAVRNMISNAKSRKQSTTQTTTASGR
ncbi:hypothetical protein DPMN_036810 [Dreissena polymorpha]|uniref:Uncharacterized protein n=1 Tax=Dreissena polymorpha TaxID=45954 RepID=A0A9D4RP64_DREPO|nr:hypothetical protein DPMN_036810 [Dreissena polymorpha]